MTIFPCARKGFKLPSCTVPSRPLQVDHLSKYVFIYGHKMVKLTRIAKTKLGRCVMAVGASKAYS